MNLLALSLNCLISDQNEVEEEKIDQSQWGELESESESEEESEESEEEEKDESGLITPAEGYVCCLSDLS